MGEGNELMTSEAMLVTTAAKVGREGGGGEFKLQGDWEKGKENNSMMTASEMWD